MSGCLYCQKEISDPKVTSFCNVECASLKFGKKRHQRVCSGCGKVEFVAGPTHLGRQCRSCSKVGNTSSANMSAEAREKIAQARRGTEPWNKGKTGVYSEETRALMGIQNVGRVVSEAENKKRSESLKEYYKEHDGPNLGLKMPEEQKEKIKQSVINIPGNEKARISILISESSKDRYKSKTTSELLEWSTNKKLSLRKFTNNDLLAQIAKNKSIPVTIIPANDEVYSGPVRPEIRCQCGRLRTPHISEYIRNRSKSCGCVNSFPEVEIYDFLTKEVGISEAEIQKRKRHDFMGKLELDFYLPNFKLAIEHHGLAHHSLRPLYGVDKDPEKVKRQHELKFIRAKAHGVLLMQIFEDEWKEKREIVKSMILARLGKLSNKIGARECEVKELTHLQQKEFFEQNHIAGFRVSSVAFGLFYSGELVSAISLSRPKTGLKHISNESVELVRFSSKINHSVTGGFQKLLIEAKKWCVSEGFDQLFTYSDCRYGFGKVYESAGFVSMGKSEPNLFYERAGIRESRWKHLKDPNINKTQIQQQMDEGWFPLYDVGSERFVLFLP